MKQQQFMAKQLSIRNSSYNHPQMYSEVSSLRKRVNGSMIIQSSDPRLSPVSNGIYGGDTDQTLPSAKSDLDLQKSRSKKQQTKSSVFLNARASGINGSKELSKPIFSGNKHERKFQVGSGQKQQLNGMSASESHILQMAYSQNQIPNNQYSNFPNLNNNSSHISVNMSSNE